MVLALPTHAQYLGSGTSAFAFLDLPVSSRLNALGGTNVSIRDGEISMGMSNPALLGEMTDKVLELNYAYFLPGTNFASVLYGHNFGEAKFISVKEDATDKPAKPNYFAVGVHFLDYGRIPYAESDGTRSGLTFGAQDILIDAMYARQLSPNFTIGVTLKPIMSFYEHYSAFALGADVGAHFQLRDSTFQLGLVLQNIGWQLKGFYSDEGGQVREMLPLNLQLGFNYRFKHAPIRIGMTIHNIQQWDLGYEHTNLLKDEVADIKWYDMMFRHTIWSIEVVPKSERFYIAFSYNHRRRAELNLLDQKSLAGFSLGAGVRIKQVRINFAVCQMTKSNFSYQAGLTLDINSLLK